MTSKAAGPRAGTGKEKPLKRGRSSLEGGKISAYSVEAINRAACILATFTHTRPELALSEIVKLTGMAKTSTFRILTTLVEQGLCDHDPVSGRYTLGYKLLQLAEVRKRQSNLRNLAIPVMREIRDDAGETVVLSIRVGDSRVHIDSVEAADPLRRIAEPGRRSVLYAGAVGKLFLSGLTDDELESYFERNALEPIRGNAPPSRNKLLHDIREIRDLGFSETRGEVSAGGVAIAAPIRNFGGDVVGVLDILIPDSRYTPPHRARCIRLLLSGSSRISERLGAPSA